MKNKTLQRVLSFCLALILCFTLNVGMQPIKVSASGTVVWVLYAVIMYMLSLGMTFTLSGGIEPLTREIEKNVNDYIANGYADLYAILSESIELCNISTGAGFRAGLSFDFRAISALNQFVEWLKANGWVEGEEISNVQHLVTWPAKINGVDTLACTSMIEFDSTATSGSKSYDRYKIVDYGTCVEFNKTATTWLTRDSYCSYKSTGYYQYFDTTVNNTNLRVIYTRSSVTDVYSLTTYGFFSPSNAFGVPSSDVLGLAFGLTSDHPDVHYGLYDVNGYFYPMSVIRCYDRTDIQESYTITVPETITEFDVDEDEVVEISFNGFPDNVFYETPEEFAEAVKQQIIDTGTVPDVTTQVETLPEPAPTPVVPLPEAPPIYGDVENLGLPQFGAVLMEKFPFCLVSDFGRVVKVFTAERQTPKWEVDLFAPLHGRIEMQGDTMLSIDLTEYEQLGQISRWITTLGFCLMLIFITKQMISW